MIHEYAIEPLAIVECSKNKLACRYLVDNFGIGTPRLMADFPKLKNWRKQFREAASTLKDLELARLEELFIRLTEKRVDRPSSAYDGCISWLDNAKNAHSNRPFRAILATEDSPSSRSTYVMTSDSIGDWPDAYWTAKRVLSVPRQGHDMAMAISPMLKKCQEIVFVDPYFRANKAKYRDSFQSFFEQCVEGRSDCSNLRFEIHASADYDNCPSADQFKFECSKKLQPMLVSGLSLTIKRWKQKEGGEKLHNRYVLSDIGGVIFNIGLDQGQAGETDDVTLLDREQYLLRWQQYACNSYAFDIESCFSVKSL